VGVQRATAALTLGDNQRDQGNYQILALVYRNNDYFGHLDPNI
jgi:hypothetical protein